MQKEGKHYEPWCTPTCTYYSYCWQEKIENEDDRWGLGVSWGYYCDCVEDRHSLKIQKPLLLTHNNTADQQSDERITALPLLHNTSVVLKIQFYVSRTLSPPVTLFSRTDAYSLFASPPNLFNCHQRQKSCIAVLFSSVPRDLATQYTKSTVTISLFFSLQIYYIIQSLNATLLRFISFYLISNTFAKYQFTSSLTPILKTTPADSVSMQSQWLNKHH